MSTVYAISSEVRNYIYVGLTGNLQKRFHQHQSGQNPTTKAYLPFILFYSEMLETRQDARQKEKFLKSGYGKEFLKKKLLEFNIVE